MKSLESSRKRRFRIARILVFLYLISAICAKAQTTDAANTGNLTSEDVLAAERKLFKLGFWLSRSGAGAANETSHYAWLAFQRLQGLPQTGNAGKKELLRLMKNSRPLKPKVTGYTHFEVDLRKQVLFLVDESGKISHILPVSTGTGRKFTEGGRTRRAVTPPGVFTVYRKTEYWKTSPLGNMYFPSYIVGGIAIHGGNFFPNHPSTYGCIKVPLVYGAELSRLMPLQTIVVVY